MKIMLMILLLATLISCGKITKIEYIPCSVPDNPPVPSYYDVKWDYKENLYCLDEKNAKNLMKNKKIQDGYSESLKNILDSVRNKSESVKK